MNTLLQDLRYGFRMLLKQKGLSAVALLSLALGAQRSRVISQVLKEGTILAACGTVIGLGGAYLVGRAMQSTLYGVDALDVRAFAGISLLLLAAALLACWFPAWRASRVEPLEALRYD